MRAWMKRHKILTGVLALLLVTVTLGGLNYSGMCLAEGRWLSDEERIKKEINRLLSLDEAWIPDGPGGPDSSRKYKVVPYESIEDFVKKNPACCEVRKTSINSIYGFIMRLSGYDSGKVIIIDHVWNFWFDGKLHVGKPISDGNYHLQRNCGKSIWYN